MVRYQYALDSDNQIVSADSLAGRALRGTYTCVSCGEPMVARVNGSVQAPHFGHKPNAECYRETYLHKTAKKVFETTYLNCLSQGKPFHISFLAPRVCERYKNLTRKTCDIGNDRHEHDLTDYFREVKVEKKDGKFIPDVSLHRSCKPDEVVYIEIAVSSFLSEKKKASGKKIIEIPIRTDADIEQIKKASISDKCARFIGFNPVISSVTDSECECIKEKYFAFYLFHTGECSIENSSLEFIRIRLEQFGDELAWKNLVVDQEGKENSFGYRQTQSPDKVFIDNVKIARKQEIPFKNCNFCQYHTKSYSKAEPGLVFCTLRETQCHSNYANNCLHYSQDET